MAGVMWRAAGAGDSRGPDGAQTGLQGAGAGVCGGVGGRAAIAVVTGDGREGLAGVRDRVSRDRGGRSRGAEGCLLLEMFCSVS